MRSVCWVIFHSNVMQTTVLDHLHDRCVDWIIKKLYPLTHSCASNPPTRGRKQIFATPVKKSPKSLTILQKSYDNIWSVSPYNDETQQPKRQAKSQTKAFDKQWNNNTMSMNIFRLAGDMSHVFSIIVLLLRLRVVKNAHG